MKADLEYKMRSSDYNVEILKNQLENQTTETSLLKKQTEKQKKYIMAQRSQLERLQIDIEYFKTNKKVATKVQQRRSLQPAPLVSEAHQISMDLNDSFIFKESPDKNSVRGSTRGGKRGRCESFVAAVDLKETTESGCQCDDLLNQDMVDCLKSEIAGFKPTLSESDSVKKYKFDNQILMRKLSDYKKAEKGAMQIVKDYEQMKLKYFNVLQENEKQKVHIQENI